MNTIEQKFTFANWRVPMILDWLRHAYLPDRSYAVGFVWSIYYDTSGLDLYYEKRNGDYLKSKVRLRWYTRGPSELPDGRIQAFLEVKLKCGVVRRKKRLPVSVQAAGLMPDPFSSEEIRALALRAAELGYVARKPLVPVLVIRYYRHRFVDPETGWRLALDNNIDCTHVNGDYIPGLAPYSLDIGVLEIKGNTRDLLDSLKPISRHLTREAFSKYARCCEHVMQPLARRI